MTSNIIPERLSFTNMSRITKKKNRPKHREKTFICLSYGVLGYVPQGCYKKFLSKSPNTKYCPNCRVFVEAHRIKTKNQKIQERNQLSIISTIGMSEKMADFEKKHRSYLDNQVTIYSSKNMTQEELRKLVPSDNA